MARIALIADVHGNLEAFEAVLRAIGEADADCIVCLGDVVGYGPDPGACVDLVYEACDAVVLGNHDEAAITPGLGENFNPAAFHSLCYTRNALSLAQKSAIRSWPANFEKAGAAFTHGSFGARRYTYITNRQTAGDALDALQHDIGAVGHTHIPSAFVAPLLDFRGAGQTRSLQLPTDVRFDIPDGHRCIVNPGSVGQPRDRNPDASWGLLDTESRTFQILRTAYDIDLVEWKIQRAGLPDFLGERLRVGA